MDKSNEVLKKQGIEYNANILKDLISKFKKEYWVNNEIGFSYWNLVKEKGFPLWEDGHPGLEASQYWGKIIKENL